MALRRRVRGASDWLGQVAGALLSTRSSAEDVLPTSRLRIVDGSSISHAGADRTIWRLHAAYDPDTASFTDLKLTGANAGEGFGRFSFSKGDLAVGDRGYAKLAGLQHVLAAGANFLVRLSWNSLRMVSPNGTRIDLASLHGTLSPGQIIDVPVILTRPSKGTKRSSRQLFPARLIIMRQSEVATERAVRAARRHHSKKRAHLVMQPMTLASGGFPMVLTSLPPEVATPDRIMAIYRLQWQIELAFKRLKSGLGIHRLAARDPVMAGAGCWHI